MNMYQIWTQNKASAAMSGEEVRSMLDAGSLHASTPMMIAGESEWKAVKDFLHELPAKIKRSGSAAQAPSPINDGSKLLQPLFPTRTAGMILLGLGYLGMLLYAGIMKVPADERICGILFGGFMTVTGAVLLVGGSSFRIK